MEGPVLPKSSIDLSNLLGFPLLEIALKVQGLFASELCGRTHCPLGIPLRPPNSYHV